MRWQYVAALCAAAAIAITWPGSAGIVFRESLRFAMTVALLSLPIGSLIGIVEARLASPLNSALRLATLILVTIPPVLQAAAWEACIGLRGWLMACLPGDFVPLSGWWGALFVHCCLAVPWIGLLTGWRLRVTSRELDDDLQTVTTPRSRLFHGIYPAIGQVVSIAAFWVLLQVLGEMAVTDIFRVRTYAEELYLGYAADGLAFGPTRLAETAPIALVMPGISFLMALALVTEIRRKPVEESPASKIPVESDRFLNAISLGAAVSVALLLVIPIGSLVYHAGLIHSMAPDEARTWSLKKMLVLVVSAPRDFAHEYFWTAMIAATSTTLGIIFGVVGLAVAQCNTLARYAIWGTGVVLLAIPSTTMGIVLSWLFSLPSGTLMGYLYDQTILAPVLASLSKQIPLQLMLLSIAYAWIPKDQYDLAKLQGLPVKALVRWIVLPQIIPCLAVSWLAGFLLSAGDLPASILVMPPGTTTLTVRLFGLLHAGIEDRLAALCLSTSLIFAGMAWLLDHFLQKWQDRD
jgi:iron(III) transport system permease protein